MDEVDVQIESTVVSDEMQEAALTLAFRSEELAWSASNSIRSMMGEMAPGYKGGRWSLVTLSNGGFFMFPKDEQGKVLIQWPGNGFEGEMSAQAAGICATLMTLSHLSFLADERGGNPEPMVDCFHHLRDYAQSHEEASSIFRMTD